MGGELSDSEPQAPTATLSRPNRQILVARMTGEWLTPATAAQLSAPSTNFFGRQRQRLVYARGPGGSHDQAHRERHGTVGRDGPGDAPVMGAAGRLRAHRHEVWLWCGAMRRLHGARGWRAEAFL